MICIEVYCRREKHWMKKYEFKRIDNKRYCYYKLSTNDKKIKNEIHRRLILSGLKYKCYESKWSRSSHYRENFLKNTNPPYRCRYCNRKLKTDYMVIDHIIPISKVQKSANYRLLLKILKITDINDIKNLAPSCFRCNLRKSDKGGIWFIRGILGKYNLYWVIMNIIQFIMVLIVLYYAVNFIGLYMSY